MCVGIKIDFINETRDQLCKPDRLNQTGARLISSNNLIVSRTYLVGLIVSKY